VVPLPQDSPHELLVLDGEARDEPAQLRQLQPAGTAVLLLDHFSRDREYERKCRDWARRIVVVDGQLRQHDCDLLVDPNPDRDASLWDGRVPARCRILSGSEYALLRPGFAAYRPASLQRRVQGELDTILVSFGAGDSGELVPITLQGLEQAGFPGQVLVVGSASDPQYGDRGFPYSLEYLPWSEDFATLLNAADLLISAGGATLWEACSLGVPSLLVERASNQAYPVARLAGAGAAVALGDPLTVTPERIAHELQALLRAPSRLRQMSSLAAEYCDGAGCDRVAEVLSGLLAEEGTVRESAQ